MGQSGPLGGGGCSSRGHAEYNSIRKLRARWRRLAIMRGLRHVGDIHQRGVQRRLAEELGVVRSVICEDMKLIMSAEGWPHGIPASRLTTGAAEE